MATRQLIEVLLLSRATSGSLASHVGGHTHGPDNRGTVEAESSSTCSASPRSNGQLRWRLTGAWSYRQTVQLDAARTQIWRQASPPKETRRINQPS